MPARAVILAFDLVAPDTAELVRAVAEQVPVAIASGVSRAEADEMLERTGLGDVLEAVICRDDVESVKPDPAPHLNALAGINGKRPMSDAILATDVIAVEDSDDGVAAARAAGMRTVTVEALDRELVDQLTSRRRTRSRG